MQRRELLSLTKTELIKRCKKSNVSTRGGKAELVDRLLQKMTKQKLQKSNSNKVRTKTRSRMKTSGKTKGKKPRKHQKANTINITSTASFQTTLFQPQKEYDLQTDIVSELQRFNYATRDILDAMEHVVDKNDINSIMSYIEKAKLASTSGPKTNHTSNPPKSVKKRRPDPPKKPRSVPPKPCPPPKPSISSTSTSNKQVSRSSKSKSNRYKKPAKPMEDEEEDDDDSSISLLSPKQPKIMIFDNQSTESDISSIDEPQNEPHGRESKDDGFNIDDHEDESDSDLSSIGQFVNELNEDLNDTKIIRDENADSIESDTSSTSEDQNEFNRSTVTKNNEENSSESDISSIDEEQNALNGSKIIRIIRNKPAGNSSESYISSNAKEQNESKTLKIIKTMNDNSSDSDISSINKEQEEVNDHTMIRKEDETSSENDISSDEQNESSSSEVSEEDSDDEYTPKPSRSDPTISPPQHRSVLSVSTNPQSNHSTHGSRVHQEEKKYDTLRVEVDIPYIDEMDADMMGTLPFLTPSKRPSVCIKSPRIPNKLEMVDKLQAMQFCMDRILRAFKVYERNYGTRYNINGLIELIQRLRAKDLATNKKPEEKIDLMHFDQNAFDHSATVSFVASHNKSVQIKSPKLYVPHMTLSEGENLCLFDNIDHRDSAGRFCVATIIAIDPNNNSNMRIHYEDDLEDAHDLWSDYRVELFRFAKHRSVSRRRQHLFVEELKLGDRVNVNPPKYYVEKSGLKKRTEWIDGMVTAFDKKSAQVQIAHKSHRKWFVYWTHVDNLHEISKYSEKSALPSTFYKFKQGKQHYGDRKHAQHYGQSVSVGQLRLGGLNLFNR